jgi:hypothetical protein
MSDFEDRARAAGRGLRAVVPVAVDPALPRQRLRRRRVLAAITAVIVVGGVGGGVAVARNGDTHPNVHIAAPDSTTTAEPATTTATEPGSTTTEATTTSVAPTTTTSTVPASAWIGPPVTSVIDGNVVDVSASGSTEVTGGDPRLAFAVPNRLHLLGGDNAITVTHWGGEPQTLPDLTLLGAGTYQGDWVAITLDVHPDLLHDNARFVRLFDLETGAFVATELSIAPGTTLDRVSIAGNLFVLSGFSPEGGPFVLYQHADGSFDNSLPNVVAGNLSIGKVSNAVISPDGKRIAYLVSGDLAVNDVATGTVLERVPIATKAYVPTGLDFDGRYAVVSRSGVPSAFVVKAPLAEVVDTSASQLAPVELPGTAGPTTIDRN